MANPQPQKVNNQSATRSPSGADLVLLLLLIMVGFGVWALVELGLTELLRNSAPNEQKIMDAHNVTKQKSDLTEKQTEIAEVQKYLTTARLDLMKNQAVVESFVALYPQLRAASNAGVPAETDKAYGEASRQLRSATTLVASLEGRLKELKEQTSSLSSSVEKNKEAADSDLRWKRFWYLVINRLGTAVITALIVFGLLRVVWRLLRRFAGNRPMSTAEGFSPPELAFGALVVLFAYDQFGYAGAALVGILLLLLVLRKIKWPKKADVLVK